MSCASPKSAILSSEINSTILNQELTASRALPEHDPLSVATESSSWNKGTGSELVRLMAWVYNYIFLKNKYTYTFRVTYRLPKGYSEHILRLRTSDNLANSACSALKYTFLWHGYF